MTAARGTTASTTPNGVRFHRLRNGSYQVWLWDQPIGLVARVWVGNASRWALTTRPTWEREGTQAPTYETRGAAAAALVLAHHYPQPTTR